MSGFWAGDAIAQSMDAATKQIQHAAETNKYADKLNEAAAESEELLHTNCANLAEKLALRLALAKLQPNHPLLVNKALQEKVQAAGVRAMVLTNSYKAVREAGESFKY